MTQTKKRIILGLVIFTLTFIACAYAVKELWFREDDLGQIINGIIRGWDDFLRVFSSDERDLIVPINYRRSNPNFISAFVRPLKNIFFTITYYCYGLDVYAYYRLHVLVHALNAALFFYTLNLFVPLGFAFLGGCMFSFFPDVSWLVWIATLHNSLATLFLLLSFLAYYAFWKRKQNTIIALPFFVLSGTMFFLSLLSRENGIFYPFWIFSGVFLLLFDQRPKMSFFKQTLLTFKKALTYTWIFFFVHGLYVAMRFYFFGTGTFSRTFHNLFLRFPFLHHYLATTTPHAPTLKQSAQPTMAACANPSNNFMAWVNMLLPVDSLFNNLYFIAACWCMIGVFLYLAYKNSKLLFLFFIIGITCFIWPALLVYPSARYVNCIYPLIIALFMFGMYNLLQEKGHQHIKSSFVYFFICFLGVATVNNAYVNMKALNVAGASTMASKRTFEQFFNENSFPADANFLVFSAPFSSDIQNIFQYFLHDLSIKVAYELFSTVAQQSVFGCQGDYRIKGVQREIRPIPHGYRIVSLDKQHTACWMHFSSFPMWWVEKDKAYEWRDKLYDLNRWYSCSIGKFKIHERLNDKYITDISFIIDPVWIDKKTIVISWDTMLGKYIQLDSSHLKK